MPKLKVRRPGKETTRKKTIDDYIALSEAILNTSRLPWWVEIKSPSCLKCGLAFKKMIYVGCLYFCRTCFNQEFDPKAKKRDPHVYRHWLKKYSLEDISI